MIIDSQVHAYEADTAARPWRTKPDWPGHVTGAEMVAAMDAVGVDGAILVSPVLLYGYDASYAVEVRGAFPGRFALVKMVDLTDPGVAEEIAEWKATPGTVGVRIRIDDTSSIRPDDPHLHSAMHSAARHDLAVNVLCAGALGSAIELVDRHPETRFVIDHLGIDQHPPRSARPWDPLEQLIELSKRQHVAIKLTGVATLSREPYPYADLWDPLERIFEAWGVDRCLWGSDWTRTLPQVDYAQAFTPFMASDRLSDSERSMVMGGACAKAYGWSPSAGA